MMILSSATPKNKMATINNFIIKGGGSVFPSGYGGGGGGGDPPKKKQKTQKRPKGPRCNRCKAFGHIARFCPAALRPPPTPQEVAFPPPMGVAPVRHQELRPR
ncbi:hypothetical protein NU195Hw_Modified_232t1 [Hortaea werneckii]